MDIIFIDTSIFESNNFLDSKRIKEVYKIAKEGHIKVVMPRLIYDEIINRIFINIEEANNKLTKYRNDTKILRNIPSLSGKFESFDSEAVRREIIGIVNAKFIESNFEIIEYPTLNIEDVFKSYFNKIFPFSSGGKKSEFPDAFALKSIEIWAENIGANVLIFSKDKDILKYKGRHLRIIENFDKYLSDKIVAIESAKHHKNRLDEINSIIKLRPETIIHEIKCWVENQLDDDSKYFEYSNNYDVHDLTIKEVNVDIEDYNITNVSEKYISVQLKVYLNYVVEIIIDDEEYMFRDSDTKEWIFPETKPMIINEIRYIDVDIVFEINPSNSKVNIPEIELINNEKSLNV